ncbi:hypothetical protein EDB19DRAFT_1923310 [Suillus lakei]|nr:hypothetical protein EDB19DRAFT_1923310 [Suillus lakei]
MQELEDSTGIHARALVTFHPRMGSPREKLHWVSMRITTLQEDITQNALGQLLQKIVTRSGDISALDWVGKSSDFNSCLPADITSYKAPPCTLPSLSEDDIHASVSTLLNTVAMKSASQLYTLLNNLNPRFAYSRLQLPCIAFQVTEVRRRLKTWIRLSLMVPRQMGFKTY